MDMHNIRFTSVCCVKTADRETSIRCHEHWVEFIGHD